MVINYNKYLSNDTVEVAHKRDKDRDETIKRLENLKATFEIKNWDQIYKDDYQKWEMEREYRIKDHNIDLLQEQKLKSNQVASKAQKMDNDVKKLAKIRKTQVKTINALDNLVFDLKKAINEGIKAEELQANFHERFAENGLNHEELSLFYDIHEEEKDVEASLEKQGRLTTPSTTNLDEIWDNLSCEKWNSTIFNNP